MIKTTTIIVPPSERFDTTAHLQLLSQALAVSPSRIFDTHLTRVALDARGGRPRFHLQFSVSIDEQLPPATPSWELPLADVATAPEVLVIGCGPAGLFAAIKLIELGLKPIIFERGKPVRERRRDIAALTKEGLVHPDSNYCFGEGGAGTFSDGKLYTRSHKRGSIERILQILHLHGASAEILIDTHPHVGTNKLPKVVEALRATITAHGGEIHFEKRLTDICYDSSGISSVQLHTGETVACKALVLATGHSARDIFELLHTKKIEIESKPFALGVRIEHPQAFIDSAQFRCEKRHPNLPAASYALRTQVADHGVFSFCMCPGGIICPAATAAEEVVVNGWSPSKRNSYFANSGIVVEVQADDLKPYEQHGPLAGLRFQQGVEQQAATAGGGKQVAPAQRLVDLVDKKCSNTLPKNSYLPGLQATDLNQVLPEFIASRLRQAVRAFDRSLKGYLNNDGIAVAVESRTSSPVRIPRNKDSLMHPQADGLFPCGEGAGYAGGILSAAMDGERVAAAVARFLSA